MLRPILLVFLVWHTCSGYQVRDAPLLNKRPAWLRVCRRSDPELNKCLNELFTDMFPQLAVGIPEINVDPFEPLPLDKVSVSKGVGPITLTGSLSQLIVSGPSNSTPVDTDFDIANKTWSYGVMMPLLKIKSKYNLKGNILVLPLVGHGDCDLRLMDVKSRVQSNIEFLQKEGREIVHVDQMRVTFDVGSMKVKLSNLFNGNKILGQTVNTFINQNAVEIANELSESIGMSLAQIFTDIVNNIYSKLPTDLWLLTEEQWAEYEKETKNKEA